MTSLADLHIPPGRTIASLFLLPDCAMGCRFCGSDCGFDAMEQAEAEELLAGLAARGIRSIVLGGGEPLLWRQDLNALVQRGRSLGLHVQICTSGLQLPPDPSRWPAMDGLILPLEALTPHLHDGLRRSAGSHHQTVMAHLEALVGTDRRVTLSTVVTRENLGELPRVGDHLAALVGRGLRVHAWHLYRFIPTGRAGARYRDALDIPAETYRAAVEAEKAKQRPFRIYRRSDLRHPSTVIYLWKEAGAWRTAC